MYTIITRNTIVHWKAWIDAVLSWILDENTAFLTTELVSALSNFNPYKSLSISMMHWNHSNESSEDDDEIPLCVFSILSSYHDWIQTEVQ